MKEKKEDVKDCRCFPTAKTLIVTSHQIKGAADGGDRSALIGASRRPVWRLGETSGG